MIRRSANTLGSYADDVVMRGMPLFGLFPGNVYWVDSGGGGSSKGTFKSPVATLTEGIALCTANNGDYIMIKPGHSETITGAGGITMDKAGVSVVGLGQYDDRPAFLMDGSAAVTMLVTAANCAIYNCVFRSGHAAITTFCTISAKGCLFDSCLFEENVTGEEFIAVFKTSATAYAADGLELINNTLNFDDATGTTLPINLLAHSRDVKIIGNTIIGDFASTYEAIYSATASFHHFNIEVAYNKIFTHHDASVICITIGSTTSTGFIHNNYAKGEDDAGATPFITGADGLGLFDNLWVGDADASGALYPAVGDI